METTLEHSPATNLQAGSASLKVVLVILNWNGKDDTLKCLESVFKIDYPNFEVVVVDNGSSDDSVLAIRQAFPQVHLLETGKNLGYAAGNNVGIRYALDRGAEFVFLLNNDTQVAQDVLNHLVAEAKRHPEIAVLGPVVYEMERPSIIWTAGEIFGNEFVCLHHLQGKSETVLENTDSYEVDWITGAAFFAKLAVFYEIGLLDERYFLVYEESDWCFRARTRGYTCRIVPKAKVWHKVAASFGSESSPLRAYFSSRNRLLFAELHLSKTIWVKLLSRSLRRLLPQFPLPQMQNRPFPKQLYWALRESISLWQGFRQKAIRRGIWDYLLRRFGDCPAQIRALNAKWNANQLTFPNQANKPISDPTSTSSHRNGDHRL